MFSIMEASEAIKLIKDGDVIAIEIESIGRLKNTVRHS